MTTVALLIAAAWMLWVGWEIRQLKQEAFALRCALTASNNAAAADSEKVRLLNLASEQLAQLQLLTEARLELLRAAINKGEPISALGDWDDP